LKSFLEAGLALKEIRDKRLYRQDYRTFEDYVSRIMSWTSAVTHSIGPLPNAFALLRKPCFLAQAPMGRCPLLDATFYAIAAGT
jgi:hypothetical protein